MFEQSQFRQRRVQSYKQYARVHDPEISQFRSMLSQRTEFYGIQMHPRGVPDAVGIEEKHASAPRSNVPTRGMDILENRDVRARHQYAEKQWLPFGLGKGAVGYHFLNRANDLLKNVWRDLNAVEHHTRLHLRLAELSLILGLPDDIENGLLQALVLLTPYELLPPAGLASDDPLRNNPLPWQQWARGCLEDENSTIREILYFSTSFGSANILYKSKLRGSAEEEVCIC